MSLSLFLARIGGWPGVGGTLAVTLPLYALIVGALAVLA